MLTINLKQIEDTHIGNDVCFHNNYTKPTLPTMGPTTLSLVKSLKWFYHSNTPPTLHVYLSCFVTTLYSKRSLGQLQK